MLKQPTVFLKRKLSHIWNNSFSKDMPVMWKANTDAQYMLNAYVAAFVLKPPVLLEQEPNNSEDVSCRSIVDYYLQCPSPIRHIFLAEFVSHYKKNGAPISKRKKTSVIRFVKYNKHSHYENYCREKLMLYVSFNENKETLKHNFSTWEVVYVASETIVHINEARFTYNVNLTWGDLEIVVNELENLDNLDETFTNPKTTRTPCESYDLQADLPRPPAGGSEKRINLGFQVTKYHFLIENNEYHRIICLLNREQQTILKDIALKKHLNMDTLLPCSLQAEQEQGRHSQRKHYSKCLYESMIQTIPLIL
jgi:hypothetical protein